MKRYILLVLVVMLALAMLPAAAQDDPPRQGIRPDAPPYAIRGPHAVGYMGFLEEETNLHTTNVAVWYPALNAEGVAENVTYEQFSRRFGSKAWTGHAIDGAIPDVNGGPYPLVIYSHGLFGTRFYGGYLSEHLASQGFVIMSIEYADSFATVGIMNPLESLYTRPIDVTWQIDYAEQLADDGGALEGMIDIAKIAVIGHSFGANTALQAAGAQYDFSSETSICAIYDTAIGQDCLAMIDTVVNAAGLETAPDDLWPSWGDSRVDAIIPLAPTPLVYSSRSVSNISVPTMIMVGTGDGIVLGTPEFRTYVYDNLASPSKTLVMFENGNHDIFSDSCERIPWATGVGLFIMCSDQVWDMDRVHDLINHFATAFLLSVLKGDTDAAAALAPDAVNFVGIHYETTGY